MLINCKGTLMDLSSPKVMGILNCTPDSFFDGGKNNSIKVALNKVSQWLEEGIDILDLGAYSSKPNAAFVTEKEEIDRLKPILKAVVKEFPQLCISVDTFRSAVARLGLEEGVSIVNDISSGNLDTEMMKTVAHYQVPYIMMHMRGTPQTMIQHTDYDNLIQEILFYFSERVAMARSYGINDLIVDPGFGFSKNTTQNFELLQKLNLFKTLSLPLLVGISRKSMIYKTLNISAQEALNGTTALHMLALLQGASILRVHDVKEAKECIQLFTQMQF
ncbi:dihydropteroate synthase [Flavobacterium sp.]|uniref:dihydropteroate synthase n=1 Tax=Flavobacterium sp. TaxID=239 RepID=UPI002FD9566E